MKIMLYDSYGNIQGFYRDYFEGMPRLNKKISNELWEVLRSRSYFIPNVNLLNTKDVLNIKDTYMFEVKPLNVRYEGDSETSQVKEELLDQIKEVSEVVDRVDENNQNQISYLKKDLQKESDTNTMQDFDIAFTQEAIDFLLFNSLSATQLKKAKSTSNKSKEGHAMAGYFASRIIKKGTMSVAQGRAYYTQVMEQYPEYKVEIDFILISEGKEELIVK